MKYGLIGKPLIHSHSPFVHSFFGYEYLLKELEESELADFFAKRDFVGINVTIPYKKTVIQYLDEVDESAKICGAVNTVVNRGGRLIGYNTDIYGMEYALRSANIDLTDKNVVILGSGGTSNTAQALAKIKQAKSVAVVSRTGEINYNNVGKLSDTEIIINATPVGMYPHIAEIPVDIAVFPRVKGVFDAIYNPLNTRLILSAKEKNVPCANGLSMLVAQAKRASEIFNDTTIEDGIIDVICAEMIKKQRNIVLIGMPGSGKTTIGKILAERQKYAFFDVDEEIVKREKRDIPTIFDTDGEAYFRKVETEVISDLAVSQGAVISCGGGAVLSRENMTLLKANGILIWIKRDIDLLSCDGRPLSKNLATLEKMYRSRAPLYEQNADFSVENINIDVAVDYIEKSINR